eukprot:COSAG02_NODE_869_length_16359_cov_49.339176_13_plen_102_part_00
MKLVLVALGVTLVPCGIPSEHLLRKLTRDSATTYSEARIQNKAKLHYGSGGRYLAFLAFFSFFSFFSFFAFFAALASASPSSSAFRFFSFFSCSCQGHQFS